MKPNSTITGVLVALIAGIVMLSINTATEEVRSIIIGSAGMLVVGGVGVIYRRQSIKQERKERVYMYHRKLIKKTS